MKNIKLIILIAFIGCLNTQLYGQSDTTSVKFSTEAAGQDQWNKKIKLRKAPHSLPDDAKGILSFGIASMHSSGPYLFQSYTRPVFDFNLSYERKILGPAFSVKIDLSSRLGGYQDLPDYNELTFGDFTWSSETDGRRKLWVDVETRYYYNKRKRYLAGRSGNNPFGQYINVKLFSPVTLAEETVREYTPDDRYPEVPWLLFRKTERTHIGSGPAFFSVGWGIQQRLMKVLVVDANVSIDHSLDDKFSGIFRSFPVLRVKLGYLIFQ